MDPHDWPTVPPEEVRLEAGPYRVTVVPAIGGRLTSLHWVSGSDDLDILVPLRHTVFHPDDWPKAGAFPMVPFANRLPAGELLMCGRKVRLRCGPQGYPVHGFGHRRAWSLIARTASSCAIRFTHDGQTEGWPWPFEAVQKVALSEAGVAVSLSITNLDCEPMPIGLGWHPYHPTASFADGAQLRVQAIALRALDQGGRVSRRGPYKDGFLDLTTPGTVALDHWSGSYGIRSPVGRSVQVATTGVDHLVIHRPLAGNYVCAEPVTALPGALVQDDDTSVLGGGLTKQLSWRAWVSNLADA